MVVVPVGARRVALKVIFTEALPFAGGVTGFSVAVADTPLGKALALSSTAEWKPFWLVTVRVTDPLPPSSMVKEEGETAMVKLGVPEEAFTVKAMVALWVSEPEVPVIATVAAPRVAEAEAVSVRVEVTLPFAAGVTGLAENAAVTPLGNPAADNVVAALKLPVLVMVIVLVPLAPWVTVPEAGEAVMVKLGVAVELTVRASVVVAVRLPDVPVIVTVDVPVVAVLLAVSVSTLLPVVGFVPNAAVTPLGRPDAASVTLPVNPFTSVTVMVLVPLLP